jgi:hypothetical protein
VTGLFSSAFSAIAGLFGGGGGASLLGSLLPFALAPFGFEHGGIVPSARAGMLAGGATLASLHSNEMVLPSRYSDVIQRMADSGGSGSSSTSAQRGGGQAPVVNVSYTINAIDSRGIKQVLQEHQSTITEIVTNHAIRYFSLYKRRVG